MFAPGCEFKFVNNRLSGRVHPWVKPLKQKVSPKSLECAQRVRAFTFYVVLVVCGPSICTFLMIFKRQPSGAILEVLTWWRPRAASGGLRREQWSRVVAPSSALAAALSMQNVSYTTLAHGMKCSVHVLHWVWDREHTPRHANKNTRSTPCLGEVKGTGTAATFNIHTMPLQLPHIHMYTRRSICHDAVV